MKIDKDVLVNRSAVLNNDVRLGIIAVQVATWAGMVKQSEVKLKNGKMEQAEFDLVVNDAAEYIESAHEFCVEAGLDWNVCVLLAHDDFKRFTNLK